MFLKGKLSLRLEGNETKYSTVDISEWICKLILFFKAKQEKWGKSYIRAWKYMEIKNETDSQSPKSLGVRVIAK